MNQITKPGWYARGYLPHFDANCVVQHIVLGAKADVNLSDMTLAKLIEDTLLHSDGTRYDLQAWCIMPDHVHIGILFYPEHLMGKTIWAWKSWITNQHMKAMGQRTTVFELDYFDRFVRTLEQAEKLPSYIENNPVKAGLVLNAADWRWSSAWHKARGWKPTIDRLPMFLPNKSR
jgi:REP element-mobilizing transposase RayT